MNREKILKQYKPQTDNLLGILHDIQNASAEHYLTDADLRAAADYLRLTYSFVYGVATFYTMYSLKPRGKHLVRVCQSPPCHLLGSSTISRELIRLLGIGFGETTADKRLYPGNVVLSGRVRRSPGHDDQRPCLRQPDPRTDRGSHRRVAEGQMSIYRTHILLPVDEGTVQAGVFEIKRRLESELREENCRRK